MFERLVNVQMLQEMLDNARTDIPKQTHTKEDKVAAVYFLYNKMDKVIYVGKAIDLAQRICQHHIGISSSKHFRKEIAYAKYIKVDSASLRTCLEGMYIQYLQPKENGEINKRTSTRKPSSVHTVKTIKVLLMKGESLRQIADKVGVGINVVIKISCGRTWKNVYVEGFDEWVMLSKGEKLLNTRDASYSYEEIKEIFRMRFVENKTYEAIANEVGASHSYIHNIIHGKRYSHLYDEMCELFNVNTIEKNAA